MYEVGIEQVESGNWVAFVFHHPGCFARGTTAVESLDAISDAITSYKSWLSGCDPEHKENISNDLIKVVERFEGSVDPNGKWICACFEDDYKIVTSEEIYQTRWLLDLSRRDLFSTIKPLPLNQLDCEIPQERQNNINGILNHIATAELWYLESLNLAFERSLLPTNIIKRLELVRTHLMRVLDQLLGIKTVTDRFGENWTARKIIRRALWHERTHTQQINSYIARYKIK